MASPAVSSRFADEGSLVKATGLVDYRVGALTDHQLLAAEGPNGLKIVQLNLLNMPSPAWVARVGERLNAEDVSRMSAKEILDARGVPEENRPKAGGSPNGFFEERPTVKEAAIIGAQQNNLLHNLDKDTVFFLQEVSPDKLDLLQNLGHFHILKSSGLEHRCGLASVVLLPKSMFQDAPDAEMASFSEGKTQRLLTYSAKDKGGNGYRFVAGHCDWGAHRGDPASEGAKEMRAFIEKYMSTAADVGETFMAAGDMNIDLSKLWKEGMPDHQIVTGQCLNNLRKGEVSTASGMIVPNNFQVAKADFPENPFPEPSREVIESFNRIQNEGAALLLNLGRLSPEELGKLPKNEKGQPIKIFAESLVWDRIDEQLKRLQKSDAGKAFVKAVQDQLGLGGAGSHAEIVRSASGPSYQHLLRTLAIKKIKPKKRF